LKGTRCVPERTDALSFRNRVLHIGDLATVDQVGSIHIVGRAKNFVKCSD